MSGSSTIRDYYDTNASVLHSLWGGHLHHGLWRSGDSGLNKAEAGRHVVTWLARIARLPLKARILDVGCGTGGTCIELCRSRPEVTCVGVNISARQIEIAKADAIAAGVSERCRFICLDACNLSEVCGAPSSPDFALGSFDSTWMLESLSQIASKSSVLESAARLTRQHGTLVVMDWLQGEAQSLPLPTRAHLVSTIEKGLCLSLDNEASLRNAVQKAGFYSIAGTTGAPGDIAIGSDDSCALSESAMPTSLSPGTLAENLPYWEDLSASVQRTWEFSWAELAKPAFWILALRQIPSLHAGLAVKRALQEGFVSGAFRVGVLVTRRL
jgi:SAM-dependent methyltransferase